MCAGLETNISPTGGIDVEPQDLLGTESLVRVAIDAKCLLSIGSDSHAVHELAYVDIAVAHLITAGAPLERVVNYWPLQRLEAWLNEKRNSASRVYTGGRRA